MTDGKEIAERLTAGVKFVHAATIYIVKTEIDEGIKKIGSIIPKDMISKTKPYFVAASTLTVFCKPVSRNNLQKLFISADEIPDRLLIDGINHLKIKNTLAYVLALMFLAEAKQQITMEKMLDTANALNAEMDVDLAREAIAVYNKIAVEQGVEQVPVL